MYSEFSFKCNLTNVAEKEKTFPRLADRLILPPLEENNKGQKNNSYNELHFD